MLLCCMLLCCMPLSAGVTRGMQVREAKTGRENRSGIDDNYADHIARQGTKYAGTNVDDEYEHDGTLQAYQNRSSRQSQQKRDEKERSRLINETKKIESIHSRCRHCFSNCNQDGVVAAGSKCYLALPPTGSLVAGHCWIVPKEHEICSRIFDDDTWQG